MHADGRQFQLWSAAPLSVRGSRLLLKLLHSLEDGPGILHHVAPRTAVAAVTTTTATAAKADRADARGGITAVPAACFGRLLRSGTL